MNIAVIPARGGSKRIPRKNIRPFHGKPILAYSIACARESGLFREIFVSTEDKEIAATARLYGATALWRADHLAGDEVGTQEVMTHELAGMLAQDVFPGLTHACCIYPCAPLLLPEDLRAGLDALMRRAGRYAFSVGTEPVLHDAGAFYWGDIHAFIQALPIWGEDSVMVPLPPRRVCDINTEADWRRAERLYEAMVTIDPATRQGWGR